MPDQDVRAVFAASVRRERKARGWSMEELGRRAGINKATVSCIEAAKTGATLDVAALLAGAFGVSIGALADGPGDDRG
jgi:transcriptional regulator with XRE-family HTH domain